MWYTGTNVSEELVASNFLAEYVGSSFIRGNPYLSTERRTHKPDKSYCNVCFPRFISSSNTEYYIEDLNLLGYVAEKNVK